jgi:hypothetical protein
MPTPPLSVLLPNYNHARYLPRCLDAILSQSFADFELVVIDDGSTDGSVELLEGYARRDARVRFSRNPKNQGVIATLNRALGMARGEYVFGAASDDYVLPGYFEGAMALFREHPHAGLCLGLTDCVHEAGQLAATYPGPWAMRPSYIPPEALPGVITHCGVTGTAIWRKDEFVRAGGYDPTLKWHCDWFPLQVVAFRRGVCFLPQKTAVCRLTSGSYSAGQGSGDQREVLRRLLGAMTAPEFADVRHLFAVSGVLRQFGPELIRAAVTIDDPTPALLELVRDPLLAHAANILRDPDPFVRRGLLVALGWYGRPGLRFEALLAELADDPCPEVATAAVEARAAVLKATPTVPWLLYRLRSAAGAFLRGIDRLSRPLHHRRLEKMELLLTEMVGVQHELYHAMHMLTQKMGEVRDAVDRLRETQDPPASRNAA